MPDDTRIAKLEVDVQHLQSDVTEVKGILKWFRDSFESLKSELQSHKTEMTRELGSFKTEMAQEFGSVGTSIESLHTSIERVKLWMVVTGVAAIVSMCGAALALARFLKPI
jgi:predicted RNase H-like nuclease (RuvC/YqgF family)